MSSRHDEPQELRHIDLMRVVAATGVMLLHLIPRMDWGAAQQRAITAVTPLAMLVDLFFVLSGIVISTLYTGRLASWTDYRRFLQKRVARLVPLHWLTLLIYVGIGVVGALGIMRANDAELYDVRCLIPNALLLHAMGFCGHLSFNAVSWSISAEFAVYLTAPLILALGGRGAILLGALAVAIIAALNYFWPPSFSWTAWMIQGGAARAFPSFMLGVMFQQTRGQLARLPGASIVMWAALAAFFWGALAGANAFTLLVFLYLAALSGVAADARGTDSWLVRKLSPFSQLTYSTYMLHWLVYVCLLSVLNDRFLHWQSGAKNALGVMAFATVWPVAWISYRYFETPMRAFVNRLGRSSVDVTGSGQIAKTDVATVGASEH
jgi:peptidoglycan/LPS O-acetylase OafA/YrhL